MLLILQCQFNSSIYCYEWNGSPSVVYSVKMMKLGLFHIWDNDFWSIVLLGYFGHICYGQIRLSKDILAKFIIKVTFWPKMFGSKKISLLYWKDCKARKRISKKVWSKCLWPKLYFCSKFDPKVQWPKNLCPKCETAEIKGWFSDRIGLFFS